MPSDRRRSDERVVDGTAGDLSGAETSEQVRRTADGEESVGREVLLQETCDDRRWSASRRREPLSTENASNAAWPARPSLGPSSPAIATSWDSWSATQSDTATLVSTRTSGVLPLVGISERPNVIDRDRLAARGDHEAASTSNERT